MLGQAAGVNTNKSAQKYDIHFVVTLVGQLLIVCLKQLNVIPGLNSSIGFSLMHKTLYYHSSMKLEVVQDKVGCGCS